MLTFTDYEEARQYAAQENLPLWDTHQLPERWLVGHLSAEIEEDPDNEDWEEVPIS